MFKYLQRRQSRKKKSDKHLRKKVFLQELLEDNPPEIKKDRSKEGTREGATQKDS